MKISAIRSSQYLNAISQIFSGQAVASFVPLVAAPILGRLYTPSDYGILAIYLAITGLIATVGTLQAHHSIVSEESDRNARGMVFVCFFSLVIITFVSGFISLVYIILFDLLEKLLENIVWAALAPFSIIMAGNLQIMSMFANRHKQYKLLALNPIISVLTSVPLSIAFGYFEFGGLGLLVAYFCGQITATFAILRIYRLNRNSGEGAIVGFCDLIRKHRRYPLYTLPTALLSNINMNAPVYLLSAFGAHSLLGGFSRAMRLVSAPLTLLTQSVGIVFFQRAASEFRSRGNCLRIVFQTGLILSSVALLPCGVLWFYGEQLFVFILGPNWALAGQIASILAPMFFLRTVASPLSAVFLLAGKQVVGFLVQIFTSLIILSGAVAFYLLNVSGVNVIVFYSVGYSLVYIATMILVGLYSNK